MWIKQIWLGFLGLSFGLIVAGSFFAVIVMLGVIPRLAALTKTAKQVMLYDNCIIAGTLWGTLASLYSLSPRIGLIGCGLYGFFGGAFVGCLAVALAEVVDTIPIFSRRIKLRKGLPYLVYALALGKAAGAFVHFFVMNT